MSYRCTVCGAEHDNLPDYAFTWPDYYFGVPENERQSRTRGTSDTCGIDEYCFIRGVILLPIIGKERSFGIGVWVSQHPANFQTYLDNVGSAEIGPFFGWLSNRIPFYEEDTLQMKTRACFQGGAQRPIIELAECDHALYHEWHGGIQVQRVLQYIHSVDGYA
jgi:hypothetical protein